MDKSSIKIDHTQIGNEFLNHLKISDNKRILFSGPFGTGKTTFLRELFTQQSDNYIVLTLNPVNYSVVNNEDIFELIKYDILIQLINNHADKIALTREDFSLFFLGQVFIKEKIKTSSILQLLLSLSEKVNKPVTELFTTLNSTIKDFNEFTIEINSDEGKVLFEYLEKIKSKPGGPREMDVISNLIYSLLIRLKTKKTDSPLTTILIVDDLDRLDPEHTFRLFNIFSAHYDINDNNKFGFDKLIFVCDVENIRKLFNHRFGTEVDFNGYIDKFYSKEVFDFDNRSLIKNIIEALVRSIPYENDQFKKKFDLHRRTSFYYAFEFLTTALIHSKDINLRMLIQQSQIKIPQYKLVLRNSRSDLYADSYGLIVLFKILKSFYPSFEILEEKLKRLTKLFDKGIALYEEEYNGINKHKEIEKIFMRLSIPFLLPEHQAFDMENINYLNNQNNSFSYPLPKFNGVLHYRYESTDNRFEYYPSYIKFTTSELFESKEVDINVFELLMHTFSICKSKGYLKN